jgi:hypothetical protein
MNCDELMINDAYSWLMGGLVVIIHVVGSRFWATAEFPFTICLVAQ